MDHLHEMLIEDEIVLCGVTLLFGILVGAVARWLLPTTFKKSVMSSRAGE